jgi:hypothetical protein
MNASQLVDDDGMNWLPFTECARVLSEIELNLLQSAMIVWLEQSGGEFRNER